MSTPAVVEDDVPPPPIKEEDEGASDQDEGNENFVYTDMVFSDEELLLPDDEDDDQLSESELAPSPPKVTSRRALHADKVSFADEDFPDDEGYEADDLEEDEFALEEEEEDLAAASPKASISRRTNQQLGSALLVEDKPWRGSHSLLRYIRPWKARTSSSLSTSDHNRPQQIPPAASADDAETEALPPPSPPASPSRNRSSSAPASPASARKAGLPSPHSPNRKSLHLSPLHKEDVDEVGVYTSDEGLGDLDSFPNESTTESWDEDGMEWQDICDLQQMPFLPTHFVTSSEPARASMIMSHQQADRWVEEECLLLKAVFQLLTERDQVGVEGRLDQADNIWKKGPLKKQSQVLGRRHYRAKKSIGTSMMNTMTPTAASSTAAAVTTKWKVKYVELRRGNLSYYEDDSGQGRKTIHLRQADTVVREVSSSSSGFVFELSVQGSPARFWMAGTEEERQAWILAIRAAMIGDENETDEARGREKELDVTPHQRALTIYTELRNRVLEADTIELYQQAIDSTIQEDVALSTSLLQIPVQWVRQQIKSKPCCDWVALQSAEEGKVDDSKAPGHSNLSPTAATPAYKRLKTTIADFWKGMREVSFSVNGVTVPRESPLAAERTFGALIRCILEFDKAWPDENAGQVSELQSVAYARNMFRAVLKCREQQDVECTVRHLLTHSNPNCTNLVEVEKLNPDETVHVEVSFAGDDILDDPPDEAADEHTGWLWTRRKHTIRWNKRFFTLSGAVLSYYEASSPRPHGLRGQVVLSGATIQRDDSFADGDERRHVLCLTTDSQERLLACDDEVDLLAWQEAIQTATDSLHPIIVEEPSTAIHNTESSKPTHRHSKSLLKGAERVIKGADGSLRGTVRVIKGGIKGATGGATRGATRVIIGATDGSIKVIKGAVGRFRRADPSSAPGDSPGQGMQRRPSMQMLLNNTTTGKREPTVQCVVQTSSIFGVVEKGGDSTLVQVRAKLFQAFLLSGGSSGRMARGDALVELEFLETIPKDEDDEEEAVEDSAIN